MYLKKSSKLVLSPQNNWIYQCNNEEIFEDVHNDPFSLIDMIQKGLLSFTEGDIN
jgi:hypothetical protein